LTNETIACDLLAALCLLQGLATVAIDLNRTHATNPDWLGHARFHLVWQTASFACLAVFEVLLVLVGGPLHDEHFYLASMLAGVPMFGFFAAFISRRIYKGTLSNSNGMPLLKIKSEAQLFASTSAWSPKSAESSHLLRLLPFIGRSAFRTELPLRKRSTLPACSCSLPAVRSTPLV
jgi:hypothetical protein